MGITGLIPFIEKASKKININEFSGSTVAIDTYCWLHKGAFACADKLMRGEDTDVYVKYCLKYVNMLLSKNVKPILVFDGRHLPAKAMTESKRRESRNVSKKRAVELLSLGKVEEARSFIQRSVNITHEMALAVIKECRKRNVDCIVAPYEADAQLAYLNMKNIAQLVITEDSDLILFGCTKVLFKMDINGTGKLVETVKLPLVMRCPIEQYTFDKFRQMCIMSGCDYLASLPGIGLAKARQFVTTTQDTNFANALKKLPSFFNRSNLTVTDEYRENFLKAEATFKHQYVYDPIERKMVRLTDPDDEDVEKALCVNAGELLDPSTAFQLALGNLDPFTFKKMDDWHPDHREAVKANVKPSNRTNFPSIWDKTYTLHHDDTSRSRRQKEPALILASHTRPKKKIVNLESKYVPETQDEGITIEKLSSMYCTEPAIKRQKITFAVENVVDKQNTTLSENEIVEQLASQKSNSPILKNKERSYKKYLRNGHSTLKRLSRFPRTVLDDNVIESKFFNGDVSQETDQNSSRHSIIVEESPERATSDCLGMSLIDNLNEKLGIVTDLTEYPDSGFGSSQNEYCSSPVNGEKSPVIEPSPKNRNPFKRRLDVNTCTIGEDSAVDNPNLECQPLQEDSPPKPSQSTLFRNSPVKKPVKKSTCRVPGLKKVSSLPNNQPTLLGKFGFQKKPVLRR